VEKKNNLSRILEDAVFSSKLEKLIESMATQPSTIEKANFDTMASMAKVEQVKNEKEALDAKQKNKYFKYRIKKIDLEKKTKGAGAPGLAESARQEKMITSRLQKAIEDYKEKKEVSDSMNDPLAITKMNEGEMTPVVDDTIIPLSKDGVTVIKFGADEHGDKQQLEPPVKAPDPEKDLEFDGPAEGSNSVTIVKMEVGGNADNKEGLDMGIEGAKKSPEIVFAESMDELFRILKEDEESPVEVGKLADVVSQESETTKEDSLPETEKTESGEAEVDLTKEPQVLITDNSVRIEIDLADGEKVVNSLEGESAEAMNEALKVVYEILGSKSLKENENGEAVVPEDAEAKITKEGDKLVVEIGLESPSEEISKIDNEALKEAVLVISTVLKEEGEAAAQPVATSDAPAKEHTPEVTQDEVHAGEQKAEEVIAPAISESKHHKGEKKEKGEHHEKGEKHALKEEESTEVDVNPGEVEIEQLPAEKKKNEEETAEVDIAEDPTVLVSNKTVRIEIPLAGQGETELKEPDEKQVEAIAESLSRIAAVFSARKINEEAEVETGADADIRIEGDKLVIEIEAEGEKKKEEEVTASDLQVVNEAASSVLDYVLPDGVIQWFKRMAAARKLRGDFRSAQNTLASQQQNVQRNADSQRRLAALNFTKNLAPIYSDYETARQNYGKARTGFWGRLIKSGNYKNAVDLQRARLNKEVKPIVSSAEDILSRLRATPVDGLNIDNIRFNPETGMYDALNNDASFDPKSMTALQTILNRRINADEKLKLASGMFGLTGRSLEDEARRLYRDDYESKHAEYEAKRVQGPQFDAFKTALKGIDSDEETSLKGLGSGGYEKTVYDHMLRTNPGGVLPDRLVLAEWANFYPQIAEALVEEYHLDAENKAAFVADIFRETIAERARRDIQSSGFALNEKGILNFFSSRKISINEEQAKALIDEIDSEKISAEFNSSNNLVKSEDIVKNEINNSKREEGNKKKDEVEPPSISESLKPKAPPTEEEIKREAARIKAETGKSSSGENIPGSLVRKPEATAKVTNIKESLEPSKPEDSLDQQYDVNAAIEVDMNATKKEEENEIKVDSAGHKAEPTDVTVKNDIKPGEEAEYSSLKEALLLEEGYFENPSVSTVTPEQKQEKLVNQISLLVARESADPLYEELLTTTAIAKKLQTELQEKYKGAAKKKAAQLIKIKAKKPESAQASSLLEYLRSVASGSQINEGIIDWVKGKIVMGLLNIMPEQYLDRLIMKSHSKALSMVKNDKQRKIVENEFSRYLKDRRDKVEFLKSIIKNAPEKAKQEADENLKSIASKAGEKQPQMAPAQVNASAEVAELGYSPLLEAEPLSILLAGGVLSMVLNILIGLVLAGTTALVVKLLAKAKEAIEDPYGDFRQV
jgi:hypothetical protein